MKNVGIITFHFVENIGASLQCVALSHTLETLGYKSYVIDYKPEYHTSKYAIIKNPFSELVSGKPLFKALKGTLKQLILLYKVPKLYAKKKKFQNFMQKNIRTTREFRTIEELVEANNVIDVCVAGSDQIWNAMYTNGGLDSAYLMAFFNGPKYTYAVSAGTRINENDLSDNMDKLNRINKLSVRESALKKQLLEHGIQSTMVLDPTFLMKKHDWDLLRNPKRSYGYKYILVYALEQDERLNLVLHRLLEQTGYQVIDISPRNFVKGEKCRRVKDCGPVEFINYIANASYIVTNSFHGTVFSIIYEKNFFTIPHSKTPDRVIDLLDTLEIRNRLITEVNFNDIQTQIDYEKVNAQLDKYRNDSLEFLKQM